MVRGIVTAQYTPKPGPGTRGPEVTVKSKIGMAKKVWIVSLTSYELLRILTARNVPGKKTIVTSAIPFIAELSRLDAADISLESAASSVEYLASFWAM
jgi:hypothetical protein